ncbi:hypothetical protein INT46_000980 [Mucor plumbeus]|uniref:Uncharacterized protein n=1 Tax=Mucor plumbeus TaxID=97098 RepID=A0A8H7QIP8_9FUNG|nr:hypothetical protein INT46_000980 [Mucor plumbeus]
MLEALELHSLIPSSDDNGKTGKVIQNSSSNSFRSDNDLKAFIKNVIQQELNDGEKVNYSNNYRKTRYSRRNDDFNGYYNNHLLNPSGNNNGYPYKNVNFDKYGKPGNHYRNNYNNYNGNSYRNDYKPYDRYNNGQSSDYNNSNYTGYNGQSIHNVKFHNTSNKADSTIDFSSPQSDDSDDESEENISEHEDLEPDSSEDSEDDMLMMLEDNYNETEPDFGQITLKGDPLNPGMFILLTKKNDFTFRHIQLCTTNWDWNY